MFLYFCQFRKFIIIFFLIELLSFANSICGTPYWMAPEVINANQKAYGTKADIWSLGAVVVEMISGKPPFTDLSPIAALFQVGSTNIIPDIPQNLSDDGKDFLKKCFQR